MANASTKSGLILLLAKLGPKLFPIVAKFGEVIVTFVKSLFGVKAVGLVGSIGLYTYLFTWQMAVALVAFLAVHEYGHLWAMKRCGIKTRGMFFLPGLGAVALGEGGFRSARNEAYIALMGPVFGLGFFVAPMWLIYIENGDAMWAAIASITCFVNLINLLPINPLDGGRVLKALAYSKNYAVAAAITVGVSVATAFLGISIGFSLLWFMALIGLFETMSDFGVRRYISKLLATVIRVTLGYLAFYCAHALFTGAHDWLVTTFYIVVLLVLAATLYYDIRRVRKKFRRLGAGYILGLWYEFVKGLKQVSKLRGTHIKAIPDYDIMSRGGKVFYTLMFVLLVTVHVITISMLALVPGAELAAELLK